MTTADRETFDATFADFKEQVWSNETLRNNILQAGTVKNEGWFRSLVRDVFGEIGAEVVGRISLWLMTNVSRLFR